VNNQAVLNDWLSIHLDVEAANQIAVSFVYNFLVLRALPETIFKRSYI